LYFGTVHLNQREEEFWLMPFGLLLDLIECHKQYSGISKPKTQHYIDEIIPFGV